MTYKAHPLPLKINCSRTSSFNSYLFEWDSLTLCQIEDGARGAGIGELQHGLSTEWDEELVLLNLEDVAELPEGEGGVGAELELGVIVGRRLLQRAVSREDDRLHRVEVGVEQVAVLLRLQIAWKYAQNG